MRLAFLIFGSIVLKTFSAESLRGISHSQFHTTQTTAILGQVRNLSPSEPLRNDHYERQETARLAALNAGELSPLSSLEQFSSAVLTSTMKTGDLRLSVVSNPVPEGFWKISSKMTIPLQCPLSGACLGTCYFEISDKLQGYGMRDNKSI